MCELALYSGIPVMVWQAEDDAVTATAFQVMLHQRRRSRPKGHENTSPVQGEGRVTRRMSG